MHVFETILALLFGATVLSTLAKRLSIPYPALLAVGGALLAFLPAPPRLELPPELILALFVAPVLLDAAYDASLRDLRRSWVAVSSLVLIAVTVTTLAVAVVARLLIPDLPWAAAIALGALLAPPDAVAALAVLRQVDPPHRIRVVLEGESLLNDASALLIYRLAVGAVAAGGFSPATAAPTFALVFFGSVVAGWAMARTVGRMTERFADPSSSVILQFVTTFGVWLLAEKLGLSGVVTVVVFGLTAARRSSPMAARLRLPTFAIWETVTTVLNVLAFTLIGLQLRPILEALTRAELIRYLSGSLVLLAVVVAVRMLWVLAHHGIVVVRGRLKGRPPGDDAAATETSGGATPTVKDAVVVGWSGMRGIVTLAAAMALPTGFPHRDFIQLAAFVVVLGTLVIQGLTLRPLIALLRLPKDTVVDGELKLARESALEAGMRELAGDDSETAERFRQQYAAALDQSRTGGALTDTEDNVLQRRLVTASRRALEELRRTGAIGDDAYREVEEELDRVELGAGAA